MTKLWTAVRLFAAGLVSLSLASPLFASEVSVAGMFPGKAILVIDGGAPRIVAVGQSVGDVRVVAIDNDQVVLEVAGRRSRLGVGERPVNQGSSGKNQKVVLSADANGHYAANGSINGSGVRFLVDTGATAVAVGRSTAARIGIDVSKGRPCTSGTANGTVQCWLVRLDQVSIGEITLLNVDGLVLDSEMPNALLGMSFLNRMDMSRDGAAMVLRQRY